MRLKRGLSQKELARRAGTSVPTVSRYESGWNRFELYTLNKLAIALGCRLRIDLKCVKRDVRRITPASLVRRFRRLFWDRKVSASDLTEYPGWIAKRVLEYGSLEDLWLLQDYYGRKKLLVLVSEIRFDCPRAANFWRRMLEVEGLICTKKFSRKEASACWPC
jgi:transcriptional regulator with XRE-family HTH domain